MYADSTLAVGRADGKIHSLQRRLLDPRRPSHKPTAQDAEELLIQYGPILPDDPKSCCQYPCLPSYVRQSDVRR